LIDIFIEFVKTSDEGSVDTNPNTIALDDGNIINASVSCTYVSAICKALISMPLEYPKEYIIAFSQTQTACVKIDLWSIRTPTSLC
jgi:hypothetical protein